ncbi:MAG: HAD-IC family P-type ATPase, partial [Atopobiaceae bacterium]|nr:HAD-IC family P-type ATPase [Atopobiaceae bacterium]
ADGRLLGLLAVADPVKPTSAPAIRALHDMGMRCVMLTGDTERTAAAVGSTVGADEVIAGVLPSQKEERVRALQEAGERVIMVGDGINDAPALARADVGMAIGAGTDIAMESADVVLMRSDPADVVAAVELSRATMHNIRQNLFWALFYNAICIPVAAGVLTPLGITLNPMIGAAAMGFSSVFVVTNALRLRLWKPSEVGEKGSPERKEVMRNVELKVEGMHCPKCVAKTKAALEAVPGVRNVEVSLEEGKATLEAGVVASDDKLVAAVEGAGFKASVA